ncbi:hypothetical protein [Rhizobium leguminosarum]|uniref:hypothetical protein n=1 Tax=Rhizobium leguminosarum TaxID=384 RepID=UPI002E0DADAC|nr:hypothetical protein U8Q02_42215 [Rhizobium leguminosarum]
MKDMTASSGRTNRVTPFGRLEASRSRGAFLGNRGDLHAPDGAIRRTHAVKFWICCTLEETNGQRVVFDTPGRYTPLFFWDEAVAMAAGHRPCGQCRKTAFRGFKQAVNRSKGLPDDHFVSVKDIDAEMHASRLDEQGHQRRYRATAAELPSGSFVTFDGDPDTPHLLWEGKAHPWTHSGYGTGAGYDRSREVVVLTSRMLVETIKAGYVPLVRFPTASP